MTDPKEQLPAVGESFDGIDLVGLGKLLKALPEESRKDLVRTLTSNTNKLVRPFTALSEGVGLWVEEWFKTRIAVQKVYAAETIAKAQAKVEADRKARLEENDRQKSQSELFGPRLPVIRDILEGASNENLESLREAWANLLALELLGASVHPRFPKILQSLGPKEAALLIELVKRDEEGSGFGVALLDFAGFMVRPIAELAQMVVGDSVDTLEAKVLVIEGLVKVDHNKRMHLTFLGREFMKAVSGP